eukprot:144401_1
MKHKKNSAKRGGKPVNTVIPASIVTFTSRGGLGRTSLVGNHIMVLNEVGNVFDATQAGKYRHEAISIDLRAYFATGLFLAYDYYRVHSCETTFIWGTLPTDGAPIAGELLWVLDKDSRNPESFSDTANRSALQTRTFTNNMLRHIVKWRPHLVEDNTTISETGKEKDYVQPSSRWMNTNNIDDHRYGAIRIIGQTLDATPYSDNDAVIHIRHRIRLEMKGLMSVQPDANFFRFMDTEGEGNYRSDDL